MKLLFTAAALMLGDGLPAKSPAAVGMSATRLAKIDHVVERLARWGVREIDHAYTAADADLRLYARADTHIVGLVEAGRTGPLVWGPMPAPGGCWLRALREARR